MSVIDKLFGSKGRVNLLRFFLFHSEKSFTTLQVSRKIGRRSLGGGRFLRDLVSSGCVLEVESAELKEKIYRANTDWLLFPEFRALFIKAKLLVEHDLGRKLRRAGRVKLLLLTGIFVGDQTSPTDILIVGTVNRRRVSRFIRGCERDMDKEVNYTILTPTEYRYRKNVGDRFLYGILENRHLVVVDDIDNPQRKVKKKVKKNAQGKAQKREKRKP